MNALTLSTIRDARKSVTSSDLIVMVITGKNHHEDRLRAVLDSWGKWLPRERLIVISDVEDADLGTYAAPETDGGHGPSQRKWYHGIIHVRRKLEAELSAQWICVVDDDTFLFVDNLLALLTTLNPAERAYYGEICSPWYCGGPCICGGSGWVAPTHIFVELAVTLDLYGAWPPPCCLDMYYSDQILSRVLNDMGNVTLHHRKEFKAYPPDLYYDLEQVSALEPSMRPDPVDWWGRVVSFHYVGTGIRGMSKSITMRLLYDLVNSVKQKE